MGFILSVSAFKFDVPVVTCGQTISVKAERTGEVDNVYSFCAEVCVDGRAIGGGKLTVLEVRS